MTWWKILLIVLGAWTLLAVPLGIVVGRRLRRVARGARRRRTPHHRDAFRAAR